jgi:hypothetical protein
MERLSTVLWQRSDRVFLECGRLDQDDSGFVLSGEALYRGRSGPTVARYLIRANERWYTQHLDLRVEEPTGTSTLLLDRDPDGRWRRDGEPLDLEFPCDDVDLAFSPSTNMLPIRRLGLQVGESAPVRVAWIQVPSLKVRAAEQIYERTGATAYRFKGRFGSYHIEVDNQGMVMDYPGGGWRSAAHQEKNKRRKATAES